MDEIQSTVEESNLVVDEIQPSVDEIQPIVDEIQPSGYRLTANAATVAKVLGSIIASRDTVESEGRQMKQC